MGEFSGVGELTKKQKLAQPVRELEQSKLPQTVGEIPWGQNILLLEKLKDPVQRLWYAQKAVENGWLNNGDNKFREFSPLYLFQKGISMFPMLGQVKTNAFFLALNPHA